jgi:hypothetical protein
VPLVAVIGSKDAEGDEDGIVEEASPVVVLETSVE